MQFVLFHIFYVHRLKSPEAHVESKIGDLNSEFTYVGKDLRREVQARSWRGHAAGGFCAGIDRLVAFAVFGPVFARDIWRQRDVSQLLYYGKKIRHRIKTQGTLTEFAAPDYFCSQFRGLRQ